MQPRTSNNIVIGVVYRPPGSDADLFNNLFEPIISKIDKRSKKSLVAGDHNLELLHYEQHSTTNDFIHDMFSYGFINTINNPTRIIDFSATLIDEICIN